MEPELLFPDTSKSLFHSFLLLQDLSVLMQAHGLGMELNLSVPSEPDWDCHSDTV